MKKRNWYVRLLVRLLPSSFRARHGDAVADEFERMQAELGHSPSLLAGLRLYAGVTVDLIRHAAVSRFGLGRADPDGLWRRHISATDARNARLERISVSWLDVKLGFRLLLRYPGLTLVSGFAMTFAIAVGAGAFEVVKQYVDPTLPLPGGERIVAIRHLDTRVSEVRRPSSADFLSWREELKRVEDLGAFRTLHRNMTVSDSDTRPVVVAEISASAFRVTQTPPLLGRTLVEDDEQPDAAPVAVIGYELWKERFGGDAGAVGSVIRLGGGESTIVGVMPAGYAFPVAHALWTPLRTSASGPDAVDGDFSTRGLYVFGRIAPGETMVGASAELEAVGARAAASAPETGGRLMPEVVPFARDALPLDVPYGMEPLVYAVNLFFVMLLLLVSANVALLMFARAVSRESEIVVRSAMGASRGRIIGQLFIEALVLGAFAAVVGLWAARLAVAGLINVLELESRGSIPFWFNADIAPATIAYTVALTVLGAAVAGVVPALRMTGREVGQNLSQLAAGAGGPRLGRMWGVVMVAQVAITVAFPSATFFAHRYVAGMRSLNPGFAVEEYLAVQLDLDPTERSGGSEPAGERLAAVARELGERVAAEPGVRGVALTSTLPRTAHGRMWAELDDGPVQAPPSSRGHPVHIARVDPGYFAVLGGELIAGRVFTSADAEAASDPGSPGVVVVNESFVRHVLGGGNAVGRRIRQTEGYGVDGPRPWHQIVGVVEDLGTVSDNPQNLSAAYHPLPASAPPAHLIVHAPAGPEALASRLRALAADVDPSLRLHAVLPLGAVGGSLWLEMNYLFKLLAGISAVALLLSLAGIYATTAFAVARRRREIGIRVALGGGARGIVWAIFRGPVKQAAAGVFAGGCLTAALAYGIMRGALWPTGIVWVAGYAALMLTVCLLACAVPTRRALAVEPTEALRMEG